MKHARIASQVFNRPHMIEPKYAQVFVSALARHLPDLNIQHVTLPDGTLLNQHDMAAAIDGYERGQPKLFQEIGGIAIIPVEGTLTHRSGHLNPYSGMTGYDGILTKIDAALDDETIHGILLDIDSPGGAVSGCFDLADAIYEARQEKPIWGLVDELCASAAFALGSACDRLIAPRTAQIGSVGVITMHVDQSKLLADAGLDVTFIYAGDHKVDGNSMQPLPDSVKASIQGDIDDVYGMFVNLVARNRGLSPRAVRDTEARVYSAAEAKNVGFIDDILPARDVLAAFDEDLRAGRAGTSMQTKVNRMNILGLGRKSKKQAQKPDADPESLSIKADDDGVVTGLGADKEAEYFTADRVELIDPRTGKPRAFNMTGAQMFDALAAAADGEEPTSEQAASVAAAEMARDAVASVYDVTVPDHVLQGMMEVGSERVEFHAPLDTLVSLCTDHNCASLAKPLYDRGVTQEQATAIMTDVQDIRDKAAATFPDDLEASAKLADQFIHAAYVEQRFGGAFASLMVEASARMSGEEVDHHPPANADKSTGAGNFNAVKFYSRKR